MSAKLATPEQQVARNLLRAEEEAYFAMFQYFRRYRTLEGRLKWLEACQAVRDFRAQHPSAFEGLENEN